MNSQTNLSDAGASYGTYISYSIGFLLSLALTSTSFLLVHRHLSTHHVSPTDKFMAITLSILGVTQLVVQLIFFLHLDGQSKRRWNLVVLGFAVMVVTIIVAGSLWVMYHLNYNMTPEQMNHYLIQQDGGI